MGGVDAVGDEMEAIGERSVFMSRRRWEQTMTCVGTAAELFILLNGEADLGGEGGALVRVVQSSVMS